MRLRRAAMLSSCIAALAAGLPASGQPPAQQGGAEVLPYTIQQGDTLWLIATRFYNAPSAAPTIYKYNQGALEAAHHRNGDRSRKASSDTIYPNTVINLPRQLRSGTTTAVSLYLRRDVPINADVASKIAEKRRIDLEDFHEIGKESVPDWVTPQAAQAPLDKHVEAAKGVAPAKREARPGWYESPETDLQRCAKAVCDQYEALCYFECIIMAKRISDSEASCDELPDVLPVEIDASTRYSCDEIAE